MTVHTSGFTASVPEIDSSSLASVCGGNEPGAQPPDNVDRRLQERLTEERQQRAREQGRVTTDGAQGRKTIFQMRGRGIVPVLTNVYNIGRRMWEGLGY